MCSLRLSVFVVSFLLFHEMTLAASFSCQQIFASEQPLVELQNGRVLSLSSTPGENDARLVSLIVQRRRQKADQEISLVFVRNERQQSEIQSLLRFHNIESQRFLLESGDEGIRSSILIVLIELRVLNKLEVALEQKKDLSVEAVYVNESGGYQNLFSRSALEEKIPIWSSTKIGVKSSRSKIFTYSPYYDLVESQGQWLPLERTNSSGGLDHRTPWAETTDPEGSSNVVKINPSSPYLSYPEFINRVYELKLGYMSVKAYDLWVSRHPEERFPPSPERTYSLQGWTTREAAFGSRWLSFEEVQTKARAAGLKSTQELIGWTQQRHRGVPSFEHFYKIYLEFTTVGDLLGIPLRISPRKIKIFSYEQAQPIAAQWALENQITSKRKHIRFAKSRPAGLPLEPDRIYKGKGWQGWSAYLGLPDSKRSESGVGEEQPRDLEAGQEK